MELPKYFYFRVKSVNHGTAIELEDASNVDVVEIVRCNDCQYRDRVFDFGRGGCTNPKGLKRIVYENNYCCHGKRREDDEG